MDIEKAFDITWHPDLYKRQKSKFSFNLFRFIRSLHAYRKFKVSFEDEMPTPREMQTVLPQVSILSSVYISDAPKRYVFLTLFTDGTDCKKSYVLRKLLLGFTSLELWCERWNIKFNDDETQAIYFSHRWRPLEDYLTMKGRNIPFENHVTDLSVFLTQRLDGY
jgi:hypothetical protein